MKKELFTAIDGQLPSLCDIADNIFDHPEQGFEEYYAQNLLCTYLEENGFAVERGVGGVETAFRASYQNAEGGPTIGMYCEYDCLPSGVHACGHHLQGPAVLGAAISVKKVIPRDKPYTLVIYGTPAEEGGGGKINMLSNGCFKELDMIFGVHAGAETTTDPYTYAAKTYLVTFHGHSAHTGAHPEEARSPVDALLLAMEGCEYMREHLAERTKLHYTPTLKGVNGTTSTIPSEAAAKFGLRSMSNAYISEMSERFFKIVEGASMMTGTTYEIEELPSYAAKFPVPALIELFYKNAAEAGCQRIDEPRTKVGSSDFGNIMQIVPGVGTRIEFAPKGTGAHSKEWLELGKSPCAHRFIMLASRTLALMCRDVIWDASAILDKVRTEYPVERDKSNRG